MKLQDYVKSYQPYRATAEDLSLEAGIRAAHDAVLKAGTIGAQRAAVRLLAELVAQRSPERVAYLERQQGLG